MFDPREWLDSGQAAVIDGLVLRPQRLGTHMLLYISRGQAAVYYLRDEHQNEWMLKKFHPGRAPDAAHVLAVQSLVPREPGFEAAFQRRCIRRDLVSPSGFAPPDFIAWVDGTLLMPRVIASDWSGMLDQVRAGTVDLSLSDRVAIAERLCAKVAMLEGSQLAHRDLSATNVMLDAAHHIHLIDWDSLYAPSLTMPANTTCGTPGYMAPFVRGEDASATWLVGGDRFALAVLILEAFATEAGCALNSDGSLLDQPDLNARGGATIDRALEAATRRMPAVRALFARALHAATAAECPTPREWAQALRRVEEPRAYKSPQPSAGQFVLLDPSVFVQLDPSRFTPLHP